VPETFIISLSHYTMVGPVIPSWQSSITFIISGRSLIVKTSSPLPDNCRLQVIDRVIELFDKHGISANIDDDENCDDDTLVFHLNGRNRACSNEACVTRGICGVGVAFEV